VKPIAVLAVALLSQAASATPPAVTCRAASDPDARVFRLEPVGGQWRLAFRSRETGERWIRLALPNARPSITADSVRLSYRNANGGRQVDLVASANASSLDVWIDHGLEVNIEPDLDPAVDLMNTDGPLGNVRCETDRSPGPP
jgi:hypothetical protein